MPWRGGVRPAPTSDIADSARSVYAVLMLKLGVNIDHVATLRQARYTVSSSPTGPLPEPDPLSAAIAVEHAGAHGITMHLREDRRHIQERDVRLVRQII